MIKNLFKKYEEIIMYLIVGGCTTLVSLVSYFILASGAHLYYQTANVISWILSVSFAYVTNKKFVFRTPYAGFQSTMKELLSFISWRLASLAVEVVSMYFFVQICSLNDNFVKLMNQVIVIILNYIFSKIFVFKKKKQAGKSK